MKEDEFKKEVIDSEKVVIVDFYADWCGPCKALSPVLEEIARENQDIKLVKINVDDAPELSQKYGIRGIPSLLFFDKGTVKSTLVGHQRKEAILEAAKK